MANNGADHQGDAGRRSSAVFCSVLILRRRDTERCQKTNKHCVLQCILRRRDIQFLTGYSNHNILIYLPINDYYCFPPNLFKWTNRCMYNFNQGVRI